MLIGDRIAGFRVESVTELPDVEGRMWRMTYEKNGADLIWLERADEVKTFVIAFKTLPSDDTGGAHILEHSVLAGSEKYPVKSPFDELRKSSLRVFMNAMTGRDRTYYPFSTRNAQDFLNLADVYLDAVFHPRVLRSPLAFRQEGWHYEIDPKTGDLGYNGVVYNEMKGVFAEPERTAGREILHYLYSDTVYGHDSGGKPEAIPHLTHEDFCAFYRKFYHPSNARIFLDGDVDLAPILGRLDGYLGKFERAEKIPPIPLQAPIAQSRRLVYPSTDCTRRTILADGWSVGTFRDPVRLAAWDTLTAYLAGSNEAPLKHALLSQGLCEDMKLYWYDYQQLPLVLIVRNTSDEQAEACREVVRNTLREQLQDGLDHTRLQALLNKHEFSEREVDSSYPRGLVYFSRALGQWLYDGNPAALFDITGIYRKLRQGVEDGLFEEMIQELLENSHHAELTFSPDPDCAQEGARRTKEELSRIRAGMTAEAFDALKQELSELAEYQKSTDTKEAKETIPALRVADIPKECRMLEHTIEAAEGFIRIRTKTVCEGIVYLALYFPIDHLCAEELVAMPLFASLFKKLPTRHHDTLQLQTLINDTIGRLSIAVTATERGNFLRVNIAVLESKTTEALGLLQEVLGETQFSDLSAMEKVHRQKKIALERGVSTRGNSLAAYYAGRGVSRRRASQDILHGYTQLRWLQKATIDNAWAEHCTRRAAELFPGNCSVVSFTENLPEAAWTLLNAFLPQGDCKPQPEAKIAFDDNSLGGLQIDGDTGYSGLVARLPEGMAFDGTMCVAAKVLSSEYLHKEIREIGGAYGTGMSILSDGLISCYTYRDPSPEAALRKIRESGSALRNFVQTDLDMERYITATIAAFEPYLSPAEEAAHPVELYLNGHTPEDRQRWRTQVLETTREDLARLAPMFQEQMAGAQALIVGGKAQLNGVPSEKIEPVR